MKRSATLLTTTVALAAVSAQVFVADDYEPLVLEILVSPSHTMTYRGNLTYVSR